ncbi:Fungal N-terminal domain-containing protein [Pleurotus pulmonarius]
MLWLRLPRPPIDKYLPSSFIPPPASDSMASFVNVGDVIAIISLATKATRVIRDSRYAPAEYQELQRDLAALQVTFSNVRRVALASASDVEDHPGIVSQGSLDSSDVDSVCQIAPVLSSDIQDVSQRCLDLLTTFTKKIEGYDKYLSESSTGNRFISTWKRLCWAALKRKQIAKLKAELSHQRGSLSMLLLSVQLASTGRIEVMIRKSMQVDEIHKLLLSGPSVWLVDASLRRIRFPLVELLSSWESFRSTLKGYLRRGVGGALIARGAFELVHEETHSIVSSATWHDLVKPEATICVNIILRTNRSEWVCPSCQQLCDSSGNDIGAQTRQQSQAVSGSENIEQIDVESDDVELRQELKLLRRFHIVRSKRSMPKCGMRQKGDSGRQHRQASEVVLTIPSKHSWMVSSEIRHRRCSVRK